MSLKTTFTVYPKEPTKEGGTHWDFRQGGGGEGMATRKVGFFFINATSKLVTKLIQHSN